MNKTISDSIEIRTFYNVKGDKSEVFRVDILSQFPFPNSSEKFVPEGLIWNRISQQYKIIFTNNIWYYTEYLPNGLSANSLKNRVKNINSTLLFYKEFCGIIGKKIKWKHKLRGYINYFRFLLHNKNSHTNLLKDLMESKKEGLFFYLNIVISFPLGLVLYVKDIFILRRTT